MDTNNLLPERLKLFGNKLALADKHGTYSYTRLHEAASAVAAQLLAALPDTTTPIPMMFPSGFAYAATLLGIWKTGAMAVPINVAHPPAEIAYILSDTQARFVLVHEQFAELLRSVALPHVQILVWSEEWSGQHFVPRFFPDTTPALMIYTSGTTSRPKGVVSTHRNLAAQIGSLVKAWEWTDNDRILNVLPMHHVHGLVNVLCCALWVGAYCDLREKFEAETVWQAFIEQDFNLFMAVPTIYSRLAAAFESATPDRQALMQAACQRFRLMVSGSAALPVPMLERWQRISGHFLLERYGMTETGMMISNLLHGKRLAGFVGLPLEGVEICLADDHGDPLSEQDQAGEIWVKGANVFGGYWQRPEATAEAFEKGWFKTGDVAIRNADGYYKILGRKSTDIIKTGGYKVSALEIEEVLLTHPQISEVAVVAVPDDEWGEKVAAAYVSKGEPLLPETLKTWAKQQLAHYKVPSLWLVCEALPRNAMGKALKPEIGRWFSVKK
jgi:malonyl-CoA/methylmalonyl-CoA synthetase